MARAAARGTAPDVSRDLPRDSRRLRPRTGARSRRRQTGVVDWQNECECENSTMTKVSGWCGSSARHRVGGDLASRPWDPSS